jgi:hypothetical protein
VVYAIARTISTIAIWAAVATVLTGLKVNGPADMTTNIMVLTTAFLSAGAAFGTYAVWHVPRPAEPPKQVDREL